MTSFSDTVKKVSDTSVKMEKFLAFSLITLFFVSTSSKGIGSNGYTLHSSHKLFYDKRVASTSSVYASVSLSGGLLTAGAYFAVMSVGGETALPTLIDTGSSNIIFSSTLCPGSECGTTSLFDPSSSSTFARVPYTDPTCQQCYPASSTCTDCSVFFGQPDPYNNSDCLFTVSYGGSSSMSYGFYGTDTVCLSGLCVSNAVFGVQTNQWPDGPAFNIIGLASEQNACNPSCVPTFLEQMVSAGVIPNKVRF